MTGQLNRFATVVAATLLALGLAAPSSAQNVVVSTPQTTINDSFFENIGVSWGFNNGNTFFNFGGATPPQFGNFDPNAGARLGVGGNTGNGQFRFNLAAGQGSDRSIVSTTPSVTLTNGFPGSISNTIQRPFVTGIVPVVGQQFQQQVRQHFGNPVSPLRRSIAELQQKWADGDYRPSHSDGERTSGRIPRPATPVSSAPSSATRGDLSVAEIERLRDQQQTAEQSETAGKIAELIERGRGAEAAGKPAVARIYYKRAAKSAEGALRSDLEAHIERLGG